MTYKIERISHFSLAQLEDDVSVYLNNRPIGTVISVSFSSDEKNKTYHCHITYEVAAEDK